MIVETSFSYLVLKNLVHNPAVKPEELKTLTILLMISQAEVCQEELKTSFIFGWSSLSVRNQMITNYGLDISYEVESITELTQFLDIQYKFQLGRLTVQEANRYLDWKSYHSRHTIRSIVFSQASYYRRTVNEDNSFSTLQLSMMYKK